MGSVAGLWVLRTLLHFSAVAAALVIIAPLARAQGALARATAARGGAS